MTTIRLVPLCLIITAGLIHSVPARPEFINSPSVAAGDDLVRTIIDEQGVLVRDYALLPESRAELGLRRLDFDTEGFAETGSNRETWRFGVTSVGSFDNEDTVQSGLGLNYIRIFEEVAVQWPIFFVNPDEGNIGIGTYDTAFNAQVYVSNLTDNQVSLYANNASAGSSSRWGVYGIAQGSGTGTRYGVVGQAFATSGARYGLLGTASSTGGGYAVYASGNIAYTGSISDVSDASLKSDIRDFKALDRVMQLKPRTYRMKSESETGMQLARGQRYGFVAQELQNVFPELVKRNVYADPRPGDELEYPEPIEYLGVETMAMVPILTRALQEQQEQILDKDRRLEALERQNTELQARLRSLDTRLDALQAEQEREPEKRLARR